jgi:transcription antitermination factor NusG
MLSADTIISDQQVLAAPYDNGFENTNRASHWYAAYTRSNHEKCVADQLEKKAIEYLLPLYNTVRKWKDRRKHMQLPLFPGYIFARFPVEERLRVLEIASVVRIVGFDNHPLALPDADVQTLRTVLQNGLRVEPQPHLTVGRRVRIMRGALAGLEGILLRKKGIFRLVLSIDLIRQSAMVEVDAADVELCLSQLHNR